MPEANHYHQKKRKRKPLHTPVTGPLPAKTAAQIPVKPADPLPEMITSDGVVRCRFDLFTRVKDEVVNKLKVKKTFCYRGDKYTQEPEKMLRNLLKMLINHHSRYYIAELYDNTRPKEDGSRCILKLKDGKITVNRLADYRLMLQQFHLPEWLQP